MVPYVFIRRYLKGPLWLQWPAVNAPVVGAIEPATGPLGACMRHRCIPSIRTSR